MTVNLDELTLSQIRQLRELFGAAPATEMQPYEIGKNMFIRTVTHHLTGRLVAVGPQELVLEDAAWIADDGRLADAMISGDFAEVEPYPPGHHIVGRASIIDARTVPFALPRSQK